MYKENFNERLKHARKKANLTQEEVSKEINVARTVISRYENGKLEPNIETLGRLIDLYNTTARFIIGTRE